MNNNKFIYFYGVQVEKTRNENFKVILEEEDYTIYVSSKDVFRIQRRVDEKEEVIAIVLAYIEYIYQYTKGAYFITDVCWRDDSKNKEHKMAWNYWNFWIWGSCPKNKRNDIIYFREANIILASLF